MAKDATTTTSSSSSSTSRRFTAADGKSYSLRAIERDLVAFMHGEATDVPSAVIEEALQREASLGEVWDELQTVAELLEYLPSAQPSRYFVRELVEALPALRAEGRASARFEELVLRTKWTVEDRLAFTVEYWRYRFRNHPVSSAGLAAATLLLVVTLAWLPGMYFLPPGTVPDFPGLSSEPTHPIAETPVDAESPTAHTDTIPPPITDEEGWLDDARVEPELVFGESRFDLPEDVLVERGPDDGVVDRPEVPGSGFVGERPEGHRWLPEGGLPRPQRRVLPMYEARSQADQRRNITPQERSMIDLGLRWLATNQNDDGSWGHAESVQDLIDAERATEQDDTPGLIVPPSTHGSDDGEVDPGQETEPGVTLADPKVVQTTARVLLAFLADNYASRFSTVESLQPRRSSHSPIRASQFDEHKQQLRRAVAAGVDFLRTHQDSRTGRLAGDGFESTIAHAEALQALAEDRLLSGNPSLIRVFPSAVEYLREVRNSDGGWGPHPGAPSSAEATLAVVHALVMYARTPTAQLDVHSTLFRRAAEFVASDPDLIYDHPPRSAAAVLSLYQILSLPELGLDLAEIGLDPRSSLRILGSEQYQPTWMIDTILGSTPVDFDYWLYASQALPNVATPGRHASGLRAWRRALINVLEDRRITLDQQQQRNREISEVYWPVSPSLRQQPGQGNAWVTASAVLTLQNSYRYSWLHIN